MVGAGPGDPDLITVKGLRALREADVVVYDRLAPSELLAEARHASKLIYAGKKPGMHAMSQEEINRLLVEEACRGNIVVRLKGGDPYLYGRGEEECIYLAERGVNCTVIPGVPSATAVPAYAGIPITTRLMASTLGIAPGMRAPGKEKIDYGRLAEAVDTLVILMGVSRAPQILGEIAEARGWGEEAAVIMNGTTPRQRVYRGTLLQLVEKAERGLLKPPAVIVVGKVVRLRDKLWKLS